MTVAELLMKARNAGTVVPAFNIPYLPMMAPTVEALRDTNSFGLIAVARLEWVKFEARSIEAIAGEYRRVGDGRHTRVHLDHVPVIDEDNLRVDFVGDIRRALAGLPGASQIVADEIEGSFIVESAAGADLREGVFRLAAHNDWPILSLRQERLSLEEIFRALTQNP